MKGHLDYRFIMYVWNSAWEGGTVKTGESGVLSLNMAQSSFTNWAAGGQNSVALNGLIILGANYKKDRSAWDNALTIGYGKMVQQGNDLGWVKTDDRIDFQSKEEEGSGSGCIP
ncbi:MAG: DUF3078 domain-containing protein [Bacteroidales bacterium]|nr:DUF3078 domain-containing protein [Bacteroidales bacterium]